MGIRLRKKVIDDRGQGFINHRLHWHMSHALLVELASHIGFHTRLLADLEFVVNDQLRDELCL